MADFEFSGSGSLLDSSTPVDFSDYQWIAIWGGICCFIVAFGIGANDVANAFASSVGAGSLTLRQAVVIAAIFEFLGAVTMGSRVTDTVRKGITSEKYFNENEGTLSILMIGMCCVIMSVAIWLLLATALEMPVSTTHSCIGGVIGMALAAKGRDAVNWEKVGMVIASWFISPILSAIIAGLIYALIRCLVLRSDNSVERAYKLYPILIGVTITINCFFIMYKRSLTSMKRQLAEVSASRLHLASDWRSFFTFWLSHGCVNAWTR
jgi:sodium-dependent phosphate transporter